MKTAYSLFFLCMILSCGLQAQQSIDSVRAYDSGSENIAALKQFVSFQAAIPIAAFAHSHIAGVGVHYSRAWSRFAYNTPQALKIAFTTNGGIDYYMGKKKDIAGHNFTYGGYLYICAEAGIVTGITRNTMVSLTAGPAAGIYKGNADFGISSSLFGTSRIKRTRLLIGPGISFKKHSETNGLWTVAGRVSYMF